MREHEKEGLCHTVWTFQTPFIGGICNCDRADCLARSCANAANSGALAAATVGRPGEAFVRVPTWPRRCPYDAGRKRAVATLASSASRVW